MATPSTNACVRSKEPLTVAEQPWPPVPVGVNVPATCWPALGFVSSISTGSAGGTSTGGGAAGGVATGGGGAGGRVGGGCDDRGRVGGWCDDRGRVRGRRAGRRVVDDHVDARAVDLAEA